MFINEYATKKKFKVFVLVMTCVILTMASRRVLTWALTNPTSEVKTVVIESDDYDDAGSYQIKNKASWISNNKARIKVSLNSIMSVSNDPRDVILVIDNSESMEDKLSNLKTNLKDVVGSLLDNENNRVSLITFNNSSEVISSFTKNKATILSEIDNIDSSGNSSYYAGLDSVLSVLNNYEKVDNTDLVVVFLTDGYPNIDNPNQNGIYSLIKTKYPYIKINGIQYDMGSTVINELSSITDKQIIADDNTLYNALLEGIIEPNSYQQFKVEDYIDSSNFTIDTVDVSKGTVTIDSENQKITWNLDNYITGSNEYMTVNLDLNNDLVNTEGFYTTTVKEKIISELNDEENIKETTNSNVLKNYYKVSYVANAPQGCNISNIADSNHLIYTNVTKENSLSCNGYIFKGWKLDDSTVKVNDNVFKVTNKDVTLKGQWSKSEIIKDMDGSVYQVANLYNTIKSEALNGSEVSTYTGESDDGGSETVYYYTGNVTKNNVVFGDYCFQIVRTTDTGGVKMIYNGPTLDGKCGSRGEISPKIKEKNSIYSLNSSLSYGSSYKFNPSNLSYELDGNITTTTWNNSNYNDLIGKFIIDDDKLVYIEDYNNNSSAKVSIFEGGTYPFFIAKTGYSYNDSIAYVGYMYDDVYNVSERLMTSLNNLILTSTIDDEYYYSDTYTYTYNNNYSLDNEEQLSDNIVGKYTFRNTDVSYSDNYLYYVIGVNGTDMYYLQLSNGDTLNDVDTNIVFGDSITDNHDGTYTLNNTTTIKISEWYSNYNNLNHKYTCNSDSVTCSNMHYITSTSNIGYDYVSILANFKYGNSFTYDNQTHKYTLTDTVNFYDFKTNYTSLNSHHYTCFNEYGECEVISYIPQIDLDNDIFYKIDLSNGEDISDALDNMLSGNSKDSLIKRYNDIFYKTIDNYSDYLEDTVYCNDRSINTLGGYNPNGGSVLEGITFNNSTISNSLKCPDNKDKFTVSNEIGNGALTYPVGFLSGVEANMWGSSARNVSNTSLYWLGTPVSFSGNSISVYGVSEGSILGHSWNSRDNAIEGLGYTNGMGIRPVISLKPGIEFYKGDGTSDNPYMIALED